MSFERKNNRWLKSFPVKQESRSRARGDRAGGSFANDEMIVKHTKPQTAVDDGPDACTSTPPTLPGLAGQRSYADAWCIPSARPRQTGRSIRTAAPVPFPDPVHPAPQDPSSSVNSGASVHRSQAPSASRSAQGSAPATTALESCPLPPAPNPPSSAPPLAPRSSCPTSAGYPAAAPRSVASLLPPWPLQRDSSCGKTSPSEPITTKCIQAITRRRWPQ